MTHRRGKEEKRVVGMVFTALLVALSLRGTYFHNHHASRVALVSENVRSRCFVQPDYSEYCILENACVSRAGLLVPVALQRLKYEGFGISTQTNLPTVNLSKFHQLPLRAYINLLVDPVVFSRALRGDTTSGIFLIAPDDKKGNNPFHFAQSAMFAFHESLWVNDYKQYSTAIIFRQRPLPGSWVDGLTEQLFGKMKVIYSDELATPLCGKKVYVPGTTVGMLQGPYEAHLFRSRVYSNLGIKPKILNRAHLRVTILERVKRRVTNVDEITQILEERRLSYRSVQLDLLSFKEQVTLMSETDLLIAAHGADLTNVMFMQQESAVLELFPSEVWYYELYGKIARNSGLFYTYALGDQVHTSATSIAECFESACLTELKRDFKVPSDRLRTSLKHALSLLGSL